MAAHISGTELEERDEARKILEKQILIEKELIEQYQKTAEQNPNTIIQKIIGTISHDSQKHILMLSALLNFLDSNEVFKEDRVNLADSLKTQLKLEADSIKAGEKLLDYQWLKDRAGYRSMIESWVSDEKRHHDFLRKLSEKSFTPISGDDFAGVFRDEDFFEKRYRASKAFWGRK